MRKITSILLSLMLVISYCNVFAAVTVDDASSTVTLSGTLETGKEHALIGIDVFCPGKGYADLSEVSYGDYNRVVVLRKQIKSTENGNWETLFRIYDDPALDYDAPSGIYTAVIFPDDYSQAIYEYFPYLNLNNAKALIDEINSTGTLNSIEGMLETRAADLGLAYDFVKDLDKTKTATLILDAKNNGGLLNQELMDNINSVRSAAIIEAVSESHINNVFDYSNELGLNKTLLNDYLDKDYVKENHLAITSSLNGLDFESYSSFVEELCEKTVLKVVKNPDGIGNIKEIVKIFKDKPGWTGNYSDKAYITVQGQEFSSYEALKKALDSVGNTGNEGSAGNGGGAGNGGIGGGGNISGGSMSPESNGTVLRVETGKGENTTMEYDIFNDINDVSWAKDAIVHLAQLGVVNGKTKTQFFPNDTITREELAKILVLTFAKDSEETIITFKDTLSSEWYYPYISRAVAAGIVNGYSNEEFGTGMPVTRQEMCTMIYRAAQKGGITLESEQLGFADEAQIADYAKEAVGALAASGIVVGSDLNNFSPTENATRAQVAKIVYRLIMQ